MRVLKEGEQSEYIPLLWILPPVFTIITMQSWRNKKEQGGGGGG